MVHIKRLIANLDCIHGIIYLDILFPLFIAQSPFEVENTSTHREEKNSYFDKIILIFFSRFKFKCVKI